MIIGNIQKGEKTVKFTTEITCSSCKKKVPGGIKASEKFYNSREFQGELDLFKKGYLCGVCRDKKRT